MKPILVLQHLSADGPAYFGRWLSQRGLPFEVRNTQAGDVFPETMDAHSALAILGGEMSANDPLPSLRRAESLIREAMGRDLPVIGHCLGGQLMARALGARVGDSPAPEVGWQPLQVLPGAAAQAWFGGRSAATVFQWHFEAFDLPPGAESLATSGACAHEACAIGPHLAMQFHVEIDPIKIAAWSAELGQRWSEALQAHPGTVMDAAAMQAGIARHLAEHQRLADALYGRWATHIAKN